MKIKTAVCAAAAFAALAGAGAETSAPKQKWVVLDPIAYSKGVDASAFDGIDNLLLTKLAQADKYKCIDRNQYENSVREGEFGGESGIKPAGYSISGEIVQLQRAASPATASASPYTQFLATVSLRVNDLSTQHAYSAETLRVKAFCETPKDMLVHVVDRVALAILSRDFPPYVMDAESDGSLTVNYGKDFLAKGEYFEVRRIKAITDVQTGDVLHRETPVGLCVVTSAGKSTSQAQLVSGNAAANDVLRPYEGEDAPAPAAIPVSAPAVAAPAGAPASGTRFALPRKEVRIAVAPFISKSAQFHVGGLSITARQWMDDTADHICAELVQRGGFSVLDRSFGAETDAELKRIVSDPNANPADVVRLCNKLAADYVVVAEVVFSDVVSPGTDYATGLPLPPLDTRFAEVRFRCVNAPTTKIEWAESVSGDSRYFGGTAEQFSSASAAYVAQAVADAIQAKFDPAALERELKLRAERAAAAEAAAAEAAKYRLAPSGAPVDTGF